MNHFRDCVISGLVSAVCILVWISGAGDGAFYVGHDQSLKALHDNWGEGKRSIVIQVLHCGDFGDGDDGGCLQTGWESWLRRSGIEDVCPYVGELLSARPRMLSGLVALQGSCGGHF